MTTPTNKQLREFILDCFNEDDLETFCFEYFPEVRRSYFGRGMSLNQKVIELIDYCDRQRMRPNLLVNLAQEREKLYRETFGTPQKKTAAPPPVKKSFVHEKTGLEFVRIPAGAFLYGEDKKRIHLPEYWISKTPVTQAVYQRFIDANPDYDVPYGDEVYGEPYNWDRRGRMHPLTKADHPVVFVSWHDAVAFCQWTGLQLPTEEQWEKAARWTDGRAYPWGNEEPTDKLCNFDNNVRGTTPVGRYSPQGDSPYGCVDMSGNVWEWCLNKYDDPEDVSIDRSKTRRIVRGGSWPSDASGIRVVLRGSRNPTNRYDYFGFRVVVARRPPSHHDH